MIARLWTARTTAGQLPTYLEHLRGAVIPQMQKIDGYRGISILDRPLSDGIEVLVITYWRSIDAIRAFAGADVEKAVVPKEAQVLLTAFDDRAKHLIVAFSDILPSE